MGCSGQEPHLTGGSVGGNTWLEKADPEQVSQVDRPERKLAAAGRGARVSSGDGL